LKHWGRFSVRGCSGFEETMSSLLTEVADSCEKVLSPAVCRAMVLLGGYGRGEGGVVTTDDGERPHNNLDFLIITRALSQEKQQEVKARLQEVLLVPAQKYGVEFDVSVINESKLRRSPSLVMWYDMRFGHKTVVGDANFVPSLSRFSLEHVPAWDILNLLVNRGTLLLINDQLMSIRSPLPEDRKRVVKHAMKAIIGYGDARLFFLGDYHWSYAEKQKRMRARSEVAPAFRQLYDEAIEFRFQPDYAAYMDRDLSRWMDELRHTFAPLHLQCEQKRLKCDRLTWETYPETVFQRAIWDDWRSARGWAKKAASFVRTSGSLPRGYSTGARIGFRALGLRGILPVLFPVATYHLDNVKHRELAAQCLQAESTEVGEIRRAYLFNWGSSVEPPFLSLARKWGLALEPGAAT